MGGATVRVRWREFWELQRRQHGVVAIWQLRELGLSAKRIEHRLGRGRLHPVHRGVYAVGRPELGRHGQWLAAVLACGAGALLSHHSAAVLWGMRRRWEGAVEVTVPAQRQVRRDRIRVHRRVVPAAHAWPGQAGATILPVDADLLPSPDLGPAVSPRRWSYRWAVAGIPVTGPIPTLVDIAASSSQAQTEAAINEADHRDLIDPECLRVGIELLPRRPGTRQLRLLLDRTSHVLTTTELERLLPPLVREAGLPAPESQERLGGHRVDFFWPALDLVVETDSLRYHRTPFKQAADKRRDNQNARRGLTTLRFTHGQIRYEPDYVRGELRSVALTPGIRGQL